MGKGGVGNLILLMCNLLMLDERAFDYCTYITDALTERNYMLWKTVMEMK